MSSSTVQSLTDPALVGVTVHTVETGYAIVRRNGKKIGSLHRADFTGVWDARARNGKKVQLPNAPHYTRQCAVRALARSISVGA